MTQFIYNFMSENLILVILSFLFIFALSFSSKFIRRFLEVVSLLVVTSLSIYYLHTLKLVNNDLYYRTVEFVCLFLHAFEISVSLIFNIQSKIIENINYYNLIIVVFYTLKFIYNFNTNQIKIVSFMLFNKCTIVTRRLDEIKNHIKNTIIVLKNRITYTEEMLC